MKSNNFSGNYIPNYILLFLYIITGSLSNFGAIDILAPQWIYLGTINLISCAYFLFYSSNTVSHSLKPLIKSTFFIIYMFYFVWNMISYTYAINPTETLINLPRLGNTFIAILFCYLLMSSIPNKIFFVSRLFIFFLVAELFSYYNDLLTVFPVEGLKVMKIKGFAGNKNITAASIAFKVPFVLYLINTQTNKLKKLLSGVLLTFSILSIFLIEARAAILSSFLVLFLLITFQLFTNLKNKKLSVSAIQSILVVTVPYILAFFVNMAITNSTNRGNIADTVGRISFTEESSNGRFQYWNDAFDYVIRNPLIASGLGNWKIASISEGKEHISGYTVPYHAHNDFIHVFTETGLLGGISYLGIFFCLSFYLIKLLKVKYKEKGKIELLYFILLLPFVVYGIDAGLNFPVARPLMQSSLAIFCGLILALYLNENNNSNVNNRVSLVFLSSTLFLLVPFLTIHIISYNSLTKQGLLLYEFNNAKFNLTRAQLDEISHDFPNLTETAMPIKSMKARYYYLQGNREEAYKMIDQGAKDNPQIYFSENLKAQFLLGEGKIDSAYVYAKKAFEGLPNNMPHYDIFMKTLVVKKDYESIDEVFKTVKNLAGDTKTVWTIYLRSLAQTRSLGDPFAMEKAAKAYSLFPEDDIIFSLYRILTYGQKRISEGEQLYQQATKLYEEKEFLQAANFFAKAVDKDPILKTYALNTGLAFYEGKNFDAAIRYFDIAMTSRREDVKERALRFKALALYSKGENSKACAVFLTLKNQYPKRMYRQEYTKYCTNQ